MKGFTSTTKFLLVSHVKHGDYEATVRSDVIDRLENDREVLAARPIDLSKGPLHSPLDVDMTRSGNNLHFFTLPY